MPNDVKTYKVKTNGFLFSFTKDEIDKTDLVALSPVSFNLIKDHRCSNAKLLEANATAKRLTIEIEGETFDIEIKDELDQVLERMGFGKASNKQVKEIKAPMPGLVLEIAVTDGQEVREGDKLLILEAMKMENSIMIQTNAIIKKVSVSAGQAVEKGQVLVELE
ncbi:acetyl-CoA carboxylase biotin carboxyl carrier protein subunit [Terrimonas alba]|uniref:acetyl-CoA carboxylase biotin carboxyl carrier protein subunit n=1 Tax=Terrimonas alba TaxID=3349636 RepID=UPI0035F4077E